MSARVRLRHWLLDGAAPIDDAQIDVLDVLIDETRSELDRQQRRLDHLDSQSAATGAAAITFGALAVALATNIDWAEETRYLVAFLILGLILGGGFSLLMACVMLSIAGREEGLSSKPRRERTTGGPIETRERVLTDIEDRLAEATMLVRAKGHRVALALRCLTAAIALLALGNFLGLLGALS